MTVAPLRLPRVSTGGLATAALSALAAGVGAVAALDASYGVALAGAVVVGLLVAWNIHALPVLLILTMFADAIAVGPLTVGRLAGALALAALAYYVLATGRVDLRVNGLLVATAGFGVWMLASVFWAEHSGAVYGYLFSYVIGVAYMLTFGLLVRSREHLKAVLLSLALGSLVFGLVAFATYAQNPPRPGLETRATGLSADPNYFAVYQTIALPAVLVLAAAARRQTQRFGYLATIVVIVVSIASSLSRTGLVALVVVTLLTLFLPSRIFFAHARQKAMYGVLLVAAGTAAVAVGSTAFVERAQSILDPSSEGDRGAGRTDIWAAAWRGYEQNYVLGLGAGNFRTHALDLLQTTPGVDTRRNYVLQARAVHNGYLEVLTDLGPVGLVLFLAILFLAGRYLWLASRRAHKAGALWLERFSLAALVSLVGFAVSAVFLSNQLGKLAWTLFGLALALDVVAKRLPAAAPAPAEAPPEEPYDLDVRERMVEQRERRVAAEFDALRAERKRLQELEERLHARLTEAGVAVPSAVPRAPRDASPDETLQETVAELAEVARSLEARAAEREAELTRRAQELVDVARALDSRTAALEARAAEVDERLDARLAELDARAAEFQRGARERDGSTEERTRELEKLAAALEARSAELEERSRRLDERAADFERETFQQVSMLHARAQELSRQATQAAGTTEEREAELARRAEEIAGIANALEARAAEVEERARRLDERASSFQREALQQASTLEQRSVELGQHASERVISVEEREAEVARRAEELSQVAASLADRAAALDARATEVERAAAERAAAIDARARELEELARSLEARAAVLDERVGDREAALELERRAQARSAELDERAAQLEQLAESLEADRSRRLEEIERREREVEARAQAVEREAEARMEALTRRLDALEQERDERHQELAQRSEELERRARALDASAAALEARAAELERAVGERDEGVRARDAELAERERALGERAEALESRAAELERTAQARDEDARSREDEIAARAGRAPEVVPAPPSAPPAAVGALGAPVSAVHGTNVFELERLVDAHAGEHPDWAEEWRYYLVYLRDYAEADGALPPSFDALVDEVFGPLLASR